MRILYAPDDFVRSGEVLDDQSPKPRRYMSAVVLGLRRSGHVVDLASVEADDLWYRAIRLLSRGRYRLYIRAKHAAQAAAVAIKAPGYELIIAGRGTSAALAALRCAGFRSTLVSICYAPMNRARFCGRRGTSPAFLLNVSRSQAPLLAASAGIPVDRVLTIPMGVDSEFFSPAVDPGRSGPLIFVGDEHRDDRLLCEIAGRLPRRVVRVTPAPVRAEFRSTRVRYVVAATAVQLRALYGRSSGALVLTTTSEDIPGLTATLEAMAMGLPVIASETMAVREYVGDGVTGFVVPPRDGSAVLNAVRTLGDESSAREMGRAGRRAVEAHFSIEAGIARLAAHLESIRARS